MIYSISYDFNVTSTDKYSIYNIQLELYILTIFKNEKLKKKVSQIKKIT